MSDQDDPGQQRLHALLIEQVMGFDHFQDDPSTALAKVAPKKKPAPSKGAGSNVSSSDWF
jgi:hypothetical protein